MTIKWTNPLTHPKDLVPEIKVRGYSIFKMKGPYHTVNFPVYFMETWDFVGYRDTLDDAVDLLMRHIYDPVSLLPPDMTEAEWVKEIAKDNQSDES